MDFIIFTEKPSTPIPELLARPDIVVIISNAVQGDKKSEKQFVCGMISKIEQLLRPWVIFFARSGLYSQKNH